MNKNSFYATRLRILLSIYVVQKQILDINKELHHLEDGSLKTYLLGTKLTQMRHYLEKVCELIRAKDN